MRVHRLSLLAIAAVLALCASPAPPAVTLIVRPQIMLRGRGDIRLEARVPRNAQNRLLVLAWDSDDGSAGSTRWQLEGDDAAVLYTRELPSQPAANYVFVARLLNSAGRVCGRAEARIRVPEER